MTSLRLSQVRRNLAGSLASPFQKLLIQSTLRLARMSSNTARTSGLAALSSISGTVGMLTSPLDLALDMGSAQFGGQPASEEQAEHPKIAQQRPNRMAEGFRPVALERGMSQPSRPIADDRHRHEPVPVARDRGSRNA